MADYGIETDPGSVDNAGNTDNMAPTLEQAIATAMERYGFREAQTHGEGTTLGEVMDVPYNPFQPD